MTKPLSAPRTHACPGGCGIQVSHHLLACRADWYRLPEDLRALVNKANRTRRSDPAGHRQALARALGWYRDHPKAGTR